MVRGRYDRNSLVDGLKDLADLAWDLQQTVWDRVYDEYPGRGQSGSRSRRPAQRSLGDVAYQLARLQTEHVGHLVRLGLSTWDVLHGNGPEGEAETRERSDPGPRTREVQLRAKPNSSVFHAVTVRNRRREGYLDVPDPTWQSSAGRRSSFVRVDFKPKGHKVEADRDVTVDLEIAVGASATPGTLFGEIEIWIGERVAQVLVVELVIEG